MFEHHHHHGQQQQAQDPYRRGAYPLTPLQGETLKIYYEANPEYCLANINGHVAMAPANESDPNQQWIMDTSWGVKTKDEAGFPAFALINRATGQTLRHGRAENERVTLDPYHPDDLNEAVLFTQSADVGKGYQCIRPVNNIHLNLEARVDDKHHTGLREGAMVILFKWKKKETQKWKISPILSSSHGTGSSHGSLYPQLYGEQHEGHAVRIYCEANPEYFLTARGHLAVLALGSPHDPHQVHSHVIYVRERHSEVLGHGLHLTNEEIDILPMVGMYDLYMMLRIQVDRALLTALAEWWYLE